MNRQVGFASSSPRTTLPWCFIQARFLRLLLPGVYFTVYFLWCLLGPPCLDNTELLKNLAGGIQWRKTVSVHLCLPRTSGNQPTSSQWPKPKSGESNSIPPSSCSLLRNPSPDSDHLAFQNRPPLSVFPSPLFNPTPGASETDCSTCLVS